MNPWVALALLVTGYIAGFATFVVFDAYAEQRAADQERNS